MMNKVEKWPRKVQGEKKVRFSEIHPFIYYVRIEQKRFFRFMKNVKNRKRFAKSKAEVDFHYTCKKHQSLLRRRLGDSDPILQENKIVNLTIAAKRIDGVIIRPGEVFSFWGLVGRATRKKGYIEGMQLSRGEVKTGVGGGICQLANLLYWMVLHTPMTVVERHHHSFDPFPDEGRVLPFGSGASVFYNYVDFRFKNTTESAFQIRVWLTDRHLKGAIYSNKDIGVSYHIEERAHQFYKRDGNTFRQNEIWRWTVDKRTGEYMHEELLIKNDSEVKYEVIERQLVNVND